jgi:hypothetical protein
MERMAMADEYILRSIAIAKLTALEVSDPFATIADAKRVLADMAAADVAPVVHEKWLLDRWPSWPHRECSRCKIMIPRTKEVADPYWQYCPNCGARMDGGNEGE